MKYIKTLYLGCESTEIATPENHIIRFDKGTVFPHPTIMDKLCTPMWEQQYMADWRVIDGPMKYCVILPHWANTKAKETNASTGYDTIEWFLQNMHPPKHGAIFSLYEYEQINHYLTGKWSAQVIWPLRKKYQWTGTGNYITLHDIEPATLTRRKGAFIAKTPAYKSVIKNIDEISEYEVRRVDYRMGEEELFTTLKFSKLHLSYHGGSLFTAGMVGTPTINYGWSSSGYSEGDIKETGETVKIQRTSWNAGTCNPVTQVHQYDWNKKQAAQLPQNYLIHVDNVHELESYIRGFKPIKFYNREHQLI